MAAKLLSFPGAFTFPARRLITLSRDLFQAADLGSVIDLIGPAISEVLSPESALVLANIEGSQLAAAFDSRGSVVPIQVAALLYDCVKKTPRVEGRLVLPDMEIDGQRDGGATTRGTLISISFPLINPFGAVAAMWIPASEPVNLRNHEEILGSISELTGAAMSNVVAKMILEEQVAVSTEASKVITDQLAEEIQRREVEVKEKHQVAMTDILTGMLNRRGFFERAEQGLKLARRQGMECAVIFADLDGLKAVNDQLGHAAGDACIRAASQVLKESFRDSDVVARLGGDEFAAFTVDAADANVIVDRIEKNARKVCLRTGVPYSISFSVGVVACSPASERPLIEYLAEADKKMYEHKRARRGNP